MRISRHTFKSIKIFSSIVENLNNIQDIEKYRCYLIANTYLHNKRGSFTLTEFVEVLHSKLDQKSLNSSSNKNKLKSQLYKKFINSPMFFQHIKGEQFKFVSYRKILNNIGVSKHEDDYQFYPIENLARKEFLDVIIGTYVLFHKEFSNKQVADHFSVSIMRIQQATKRNDKKGLVKKITRLIEIDCVDKKDAIDKRIKLWNVGICSIIKRKKGRYYLYCYRTNAYKSELPSHKRRVRKSAGPKIVKKYSEIITNWTFLSLYGKQFHLKKKEENFRTFLFHKKGKWNLDDYIMEYGSFVF